MQVVQKEVAVTSGHRRQRISFVLATVSILGFAVPAQAQLRLNDICRVKGQEENTLHGLGYALSWYLRPFGQGIW